MNRSQNLRHLAVVAVLVAIVTALTAVLLRSLKLFQPPASAQAGPIDALMGAHIIAIAFLFALIVVFMVYSVIVFRRRAGDDSDGAHIHGNTTLEIVWTILPLITVLFFAYLGGRALSEVTAASPDEMVVEVDSLKYDWLFTYPSLGVENSQDLVLPVNQQVLLKITSLDVIHDFWVPEFRVKQDAVPGLVTELRITPTEEGGYQVRCNELCGVLHHAMLADVRVVSRGEFDAWVAAGVAAAQSAAEAAAGLSELAQRGAELYTSNGCNACHKLDPAESAAALAPTWVGLFGSERPLQDGTVVVADETYLRDSILNPANQIVAECPLGPCSPIMPPNYRDTLSDEDISAIIEYIKSLSE